jgi:hypothetical protein
MKRSDRLKIKLDHTHHVPSKPHSEPHNDGARNNKRDVTGSIEIRGHIETTIPRHLIQKEDSAEVSGPQSDPINFALRGYDANSFLCVALGGD